MIPAIIAAAGFLGVLTLLLGALETRLARLEERVAKLEDMNRTATEVGRILGSPWTS